MSRRWKAEPKPSLMDTQENGHEGCAKKKGKATKTKGRCKREWKESGDEGKTLAKAGKQTLTNGTPRRKIENME